MGSFEGEEGFGFVVFVNMFFEIDVITTLDMLRTVTTFNVEIVGFSIGRYKDVIN